MVFILAPKVKQEEIDVFIREWQEKGFSAVLSVRPEHTAVCVSGNTAAIDMNHIVRTKHKGKFVVIGGMCFAVIVGHGSRLRLTAKSIIARTVRLRSHRERAMFATIKPATSIYATVRPGIPLVNWIK